MALINMVKKMSFLPSALNTPLLNIQPVLSTAPLRTYIKNFDNEETAIKPPVGWMHQNRSKQGYRTYKSRRAHGPDEFYSEVKRVRVYGYDKLMSTEGGRKRIMKKILLGEDCLSQ